MTMKLPFPLLLATLVTGLAPGQEPRIDLEARERSVELLESRIDWRERQLAELGEEIMTAYRRLDTKLGHLADRLARVTDSPRSRYRVGKAKLELMENLKTTVETFIAKRDALERSLRTGAAERPVEDVRAEIDYLNSETDRHLSHMVELSRSFARDENVAKYEQVGGSGSVAGGYGWYEETVEISDEWRQNRRDRTLDRKQRRQMIGVIERAIERCTANIDRAGKLLEEPSLSDLERRILRSELDSHRSMLERRQRQKTALLDVEQPATTEVGRDLAREIEDAVDDALDEVQGDLRLISVKHLELRRRQAELADMRETLEARKRWLEEHRGETVDSE